MCRAHRIAKNVFGIVYAVFRVLRMTMQLSPQKTSMTLQLRFRFIITSETGSLLITHRLAHSILRMPMEIGSWRAVNTNGVPLQPLNRAGRRNTAVHWRRATFSKVLAKSRGGGGGS
jgi:hypothetical protein